MNFNQKNKTIILIVGICLISSVVIGYRLYRKGYPQKNPEQQKAAHKALLMISDLPKINSTTTEQVKEMLEEAFTQNKLVISSTYQIARTENSLVLAAPSFSKDVDEMGTCDLNDNPYCGLFEVTATSSRLVMFGSKLTGFQKVERFIDAQHAQILTSWSLFNFTSIDRKQLNLETGELLPLLITETDQDSQSASINIIGDGRVVMLVVEGSTVKSRLVPERVTLQDSNHLILSTLSSDEIHELQTNVTSDADQRVMTIVIHPTDNDVINKSLLVDLCGVTYKIELDKNAIKKVN